MTDYSQLVSISTEDIRKERDKIMEPFNELVASMVRRTYEIEDEIFFDAIT